MVARLDGCSGERPHVLDAEARLDAARSSQRAWGGSSVAERLAVLRRARGVMARRAMQLAATIEQRPAAETLTAEVIPLLEASVFLERHAARILNSRRHRRARAPLWLRGVELEVEREPFGAVLIIAPSNYPLMLPGIQAIQALAAGNAVIVKPAPGTAPPLHALRDALAAAGLPSGLLTVAPDTHADAIALLRARPDKVIFTGSAAAGRAALAIAAEAPTPFVAELSGHDAAFVRADAEVAEAAGTLVFGMTLNGGATCIAPRRVLVARGLAANLERELAQRLAAKPAFSIGEAVAELAAELMDDALRQGARIVCGGPSDGNRRGDRAMLRPTVLAGVTARMRIWRTELFAPVLCIASVDDDEDALQQASQCPYALGAIVLGRDVAAARRFARRVEAGLVIVNDAIVPGADPRVPLAPRGQSGFGSTRGAEGLLELTRPKAVIVARGPRPHASRRPPRAESIATYIEAAYGEGARARLGALRRLLASPLRLAGDLREGKE